MLGTRCSLQADKVAVLLSNDRHDTDIPIIEAAVSHLALDLAGQPEEQQVAGSWAMQLHVDVYNNSLMGWEPLIEPWTSSMAMVVPLTRCYTQHCAQYLAVFHLCSS